MQSIPIQLLGYEGCPLQPMLERELGRALTLVDRPQRFRVERIDVLDPRVPLRLRRWGSPTLLIDGEDVAGGSPGEAAACRVYDGPGAVPDAETIVKALHARCYQ